LHPLIYYKIILSLIDAKFLTHNDNKKGIETKQLVIQK